MADIDVDHTGRNHILVANGVHLGAVGNPVLELLAEGEFHIDAVALDLHVRNLPHIYTANLHAGAGPKSQGLVEGTVELILLHADHSAGKKLRIEHKPEHHHGNRKEDTNIKAGLLHPVYLLDGLELHEKKYRNRFGQCLVINDW